VGGGCWHGYLSVQVGFTFLVPAHLGSPGHSPGGGHKMVVVVVVVVLQSYYGENLWRLQEQVLCRLYAPHSVKF